MPLLLLQTLIGFGVTMLYRQATLNTAFSIGGVSRCHTKVHARPRRHGVVSFLIPVMCVIVSFERLLKRKKGGRIHLTPPTMRCTI